MLAAFWAAEDGDIPAVISEAGNRTCAEANANANRLVRAMRARGVEAGDGIALMCSNRPEFWETVAAARRAGLRLTTVNWHLTGDEAGYIVDDCEATVFVADARFAAGRAAPRPTSRRGSWRRSRSADRSTASTTGTTCSRPRRATTSTIRVVGSTMLYTSGTTGRPKGVRRPPEPRERRSTSRSSPQYRRPAARASLHRPAVPRRAVVVLADRARCARCADRDDGRMVGRAHARAHRGAPRHAHAHGADDVPPPAVAARRREGALRHLVARCSSSTARRRARST